jgi:hypothetical protein
MVGLSDQKDYKGMVEFLNDATIVEKYLTKKHSFQF